MKRATSFGLLLVLSALGCGSSDDAPGPEDCGNGADDNGDGYIDCGDALCAADAACDVPEAEALVVGDGLILEDVSDDGALIAYTDAASSLYVISSSGGEPQLIAEAVERARFEGNILTLFRGVVTADNTAASMQRWEPDGAVEDVGALVVLSSVRASPDSQHLYHEERIAQGSGIKDLFLDGQRVVSGADKERSRFSDDSQWLVIGTDVDDGGGGTINQVLAVPTDGGGVVTLVASDASNRFQITNDSATVVVAPNERGPVADLASVPITGGAQSLLVADASDRGFQLSDDGDNIVLLMPDDAGNPSDFGLYSLPITGGTPEMLVGSGVDDVASTATDGVVYSTGTDANGLQALRYVGLDGSGDRDLGTRALDDGFNQSGSVYVFLDQVVAGGGDPGRLQAYHPANDRIETLGADVVRASFVDDQRVVFRDERGGFRLAELNGAALQLLHPAVDDYEEIHDGDGVSNSGRVVFSVMSGAEPGIFILSLP